MLRNLILTFLPLIMQGQTIYYDFESQSLEDWEQFPNEHWSIDSQNIQGAFSLHQSFDNTEEGEDRISLSHIPLDMNVSLTQWKFSVKYPNNPSSANSWSVFFTSDNAAAGMHKGGEANGYVFGVNFTGTSDALGFWKQENGTASSLFESELTWNKGFQNGTPIHIQISREINGTFLFEADTLGEGNYFSIGSYTDRSFTISTHFGVVNMYTQTKDQLLWVDGVSITGTFTYDSIPPELTSMKTIDENTIRLHFSEAVSISPDAFFLLNDSDTCRNFTAISDSIIQIKSNTYFNNENHFTIYGITDLVGNAVNTNSPSFIYPVAAFHNIIITEFLADPEPSIGLPPFEFIEIYNTTSIPFNLGNYQLKINGSIDKLPATTLLPGAYAILCSQSDTTAYSTYGRTIGVPGMSAITNAASAISILNFKGALLHHIEYAIDWYKSSKSEGGWSLEMIDTDYPCSNKTNWSESVAANGGTPGQANSISGANPDTLIPAIENLFADAAYITISFSKPMDSLAVSNPEFFTFSNNMAAINAIEIKNENYSELELSLLLPLENKTDYAISFSNNIKDCSGNGLKATTIPFQLTENTESGDILINEILYEPSDGNAEFIELFNKSEKWLNLKNLRFTEIDAFTLETWDEKQIAYDNHFFPPNYYLVITENKSLVTEYYEELDEAKIIETPSRLNLTNTGATIGIINPENKVIDVASYHPQMHYALLSETQDVSLERINCLKSGLEWNNWHSASSTSGYATPTELNSQASRLSNTSPAFSMSNNKFSPNNDGYQDYLSIAYNFNSPGWTATARIYSIHGNLIAELLNNKLLDTKGTILWNGEDEKRKILPSGYYIVFIEAFHPAGDKKHLKETCVLLP